MAARALLLALVAFSALLYGSVLADTDCGYTPAPWTNDPPVQQGVSSWFNIVTQQGGNGACGQIHDANDIMVAAIGFPNLADMCGQCGNCFNVTGPVGSVVVRVIDYCDLGASQCTSPVWTLNEAPYIIIAGSTNTGSVPVTYFPVACPESGNVYFNWGAGNVGEFYIPLHVGFHRYPLQSVEYEFNGGWLSLPQSVGDIWWSNPAGPAAVPAQVRLNSTTGDSIVDTISFAFNSTSNHDGSVQFALFTGDGAGDGDGDGDAGDGDGGAASVLFPNAVFTALLSLL